MKRDFYNNLLEWKNNFIDTPLMVVGARQVGKTYIIDKFCSENFTDYIYLNLQESPRIIELFARNIATSEKVKLLEYELKRKITEDTIIFFDEVQESEDIIASMKYFAESAFPYKIILAGSLLGVKLKQFSKSFPVGKVLINYMYPMSFREFLYSINKENYIPLIEECYNMNKPMVETFHIELLNDYRTFLLTGGMPKAITEYIKANSMTNNQIILRTIIDSYLADMKRYTKNVTETNKIARIYNNIPVQLAKENKKYQFSKLDKNARMRDYETSFEWLLASKLIIPCYYVNKFETPLKAYQDDENFKIYLSDVGLLIELLNISPESILSDNNFMFKGAIAEEYVATELIKNDFNLYYYNKPQLMEIDFLIDSKDGVIPIEVKASDNVKSSSLNKFNSKYNPNYSIRISSKNFVLENNIKSVPLYAVFCIKK